MAALSRFWGTSALFFQTFGWTINVTKIFQNLFSIVKFTYQLCPDDVPVLCIRFVVRVLHQSVIFEDSFPILIIFLIRWILASELFYRNLVTIVVLENQVAKIRGLIFFAEFDINISLTRSLRFGSDFAWNSAICHDYIELIVFLQTTEHPNSCIVCSVHLFKI